MVKDHKLHAAVKSNNLNNVLKVLDKYNKQKFRSSSNKCKKIDFEQRDNLGLTAIHHAARNGSIEILETLLVHGSVFDVFDSHCLRPLGYACAEGHIKVVDYLLRWGSSANRVSAMEYLTPLHLSAMYGYVEIVHLLLSYKADPFAINKDNKTPIDLACAYGKYNVINLLFSFTTNLANKNKHSNSNFSDGYGPKTPQSDQISRCHKFNQANVTGTPKVERGLHRRCSSPYGSSNTSGSSGSNNYNNSTQKNRVIRNMSSTDADCNSPCVPHCNMRYSLRSTVRSNCYPHHDITESTMQSVNDGCVPPTLDATSVTDIPDDLRQNLREACFAVQARAVMPFGSDFDGCRTISFETGDLITVLKQYHNGVLKGFVTSEGISSTGLFPPNYVVFINDHRPSACCDKPININMFQSPEKTPIPNRVKPNKERPTYLDLQDTNHPINNESDADNDAEEGSPILIPPQMSSIRTNVIITDVNHSIGTSSVNCRPTDLPSARINDFTYCLSLGQGLISVVNGSVNKRNSIASMDSGRGSATDSKSVASGSNPAFNNSSKPPSSPMHCCQSKNNSDLDSSQCRCHVCAILPPTVPTPFHQFDNQSSQFYQTTFKQESSPDLDVLLPRTSSFSQQMSIDSLYYPCSMISLDDTQYSSDSSDRGIDDIMVNWLYSVGLGNYADLLSNIGYDLATLIKATPEDLNASGITNPKDRHFMKTQLNRLSIYDGLPETMPLSIHDFLDGLKLLQYEELLSKQNFSKIEHLFGLTWEDLADIGIEKLGHQKKLSLAMERLSRLSQSSNSGNDYKQTFATPSKQAHGSPNKFPSVSQSRSFEELPYPTAIMTSQEPSENESRTRYKRLKLLPLKTNMFTINNNNNNNTNNGLLSKSDESVSSVCEMPWAGYSTMQARQEDMSLSSSASSCSQESGKDDSRISQNPNPSLASNFSHDNMGTVRIKRPMTSLAQDCVSDPS